MLRVTMETCKQGGGITLRVSPLKQGKYEWNFPFVCIDSPRVMNATLRPLLRPSRPAVTSPTLTFAGTGESETTAPESYWNMKAVLLLIGPCHSEEHVPFGLHLDVKSKRKWCSACYLNPRLLLPWIPHFATEAKKKEFLSINKKMIHSGNMVTVRTIQSSPVSVHGGLIGLHNSKCTTVIKQKLIVKLNRLNLLLCEEKLLKNRFRTKKKLQGWLHGGELLSGRTDEPALLTKDELI